MVLFRSKEDQHAPFMDTFRDIAEAHKGKILFSYSDIIDDSADNV